MIHQAARADLGERERDAFRTLAAASPQVRTQGIGDFAADQTGRATPPDGDRAARPAHRQRADGRTRPRGPPSRPRPGRRPGEARNGESTRAS